MNRIRKHQKNSLLIEPTDAPNSTFIGITTLHVSDSLSAHNQEFLGIHRLSYILCNCDDRLLPGSRMALVPSNSKFQSEHRRSPLRFVTFSSLSQYRLMLKLSPDRSTQQPFQCIIDYHFHLIKKLHIKPNISRQNEK